MLKAWILLYYVSGGHGAGPDSAEFYTEEACLQAKREMAQAIDDGFALYLKYALCVPAGGMDNGLSQKRN